MNDNATPETETDFDSKHAATQVRHRDSLNLEGPNCEEIKESRGGQGAITHENSNASSAQEEKLGLRYDYYSDSCTIEDILQHPMKNHKEVHGEYTDQISICSLD